MSTPEVDAVHQFGQSPPMKESRHVLSEQAQKSCSVGAPSEKTSGVDQTPSPTGCSSDGTELRPVGVRSATTRTSLNVPSPEPVAPIPVGIAQSPEEKAGNLSMEAMHTKLDCSDELCVLSDESSLAVADDALEDSLLSSLTAPGMDHLVKGLEDHLELEPVKLCCETTEWLEPVPDVPVPELEHSADASSDPDEEPGKETMHLCDDEEGSHNLPDEFKLDDKDFDVFRDVRGVRFHQKRSVPVIPSTPPQFPASPALDMGDIKDDIVDLNTNEKPIQDELQEVTLD